MRIVVAAVGRLDAVIARGFHHAGQPAVLARNRHAHDLRIVQIFEIPFQRFGENHLAVFELTADVIDFRNDFAGKFLGCLLPLLPVSEQLVED